MTQSGRKAGLLVGALVGLGSLALLSYFIGAGRDRTGPLAEAPTPSISVLGGVSISPGENPFGEGRKVSLEEAQQLVPFHVYRANDDLASDGSLVTVWFEDAGAAEGDHVYQVALQYSSGVEVLLGTPTANEIADPEGFIKSLADGLPGAVVQQVHGVSSLVLPFAEQRTPASVTMILEGSQVQVVGHYPESDIVKVAESLS